jgi:hypothetical protein
MGDSIPHSVPTLVGVSVVVRLYIIKNRGIPYRLVPVPERFFGRKKVLIIKYSPPRP